MFNYFLTNSFVVTESVFKHDVDSLDNLGVADLAVGGGEYLKHCKLTAFTAVWLLYFVKR